MEAFNVFNSDVTFKKCFIFNSSSKKPVLLSGKLHVTTIKSPSAGNKCLIFNVDKIKSDRRLISCLYSFNKFLTDVIEENVRSFITDNDDGTCSITIYDFPDQMNFKKPYKILTQDFIKFENFDIMISINIFRIKTYVNFMSGLKLVSHTILYNSTIYEQYGINDKMKLLTNKKIDNSIRFNRYAPKKSDIVDNIMGIIDRKN